MILQNSIGLEFYLKKFVGLLLDILDCFWTNRNHWDGKKKKKHLIELININFNP